MCLSQPSLKWTKTNDPGDSVRGLLEKVRSGEPVQQEEEVKVTQGASNEPIVVVVSSGEPVKQEREVKARQGA